MTGFELFLNISIGLREVDVEDKSEVEIEGIEEVGSESIIERELETIIASLHTPQWRERERENRKDDEGNHNRITNAKGFTITEYKEICKHKLKKINYKKAQA